MGGWAPLVAQTLLEGGVVGWAGWELWKLRGSPATREDKPSGADGGRPASARDEDSSASAPAREGGDPA